MARRVAAEMAGAHKSKKREKTNTAAVPETISQGGSDATTPATPSSAEALDAMWDEVIQSTTQLWKKEKRERERKREVYIYPNAGE
jgi:hypothetical protein